MSEVKRSDVFMRSERGGEWFDEFLETYANTKESYTQEIMNIIQDRKAETVQGVVSKYREMVGLDALADIADEDSEIISKASSPLSKRAGQHPEQSVIMVIQENPDIKNDVESMCRHSGGTKGTHAIINFLREKLGKDLVSYSNQDLVKYIENLKDQYKHNMQDEHVDLGMVGTESTDNVDDTADYITHGKGM